MNMKKAIALSLAIMILVAASVAGTIAWLQDKTEPVVNTFSTAGIQITLKESPITITDGAANYDTPAENVTNVYPAVPGTEYKKDPVVSVLANSEECYLFVKFEETDNPATYYTYSSNLTTEKGWTQGDGTNIPADVWYRTVAKANTITSYNLLDGDRITVKDTVTNENMTTAAAAQLKWTAYAIQTANTGTPAEAWAKISNPTP